MYQCEVQGVHRAQLSFNTLVDLVNLLGDVAFGEVAVMRIDCLKFTAFDGHHGLNK